MLGQVAPVVMVAALPLVPAIMAYLFAKRCIASPSAVLGVILAYGEVLGFVAVAQLDPRPPLGSVDGLAQIKAVLTRADRGTLKALLCMGIAYTLAITSIDMDIWPALQPLQ